MAGLSLLHRAGLKSGIISGRSSQVVIRRHASSNRVVRQGVPRRIEAYEECSPAAWERELSAYVERSYGYPDAAARIGGCVADASEETRFRSSLCTQRKVDAGAVGNHRSNPEIAGPLERSGCGVFQIVMAELG